MEKYLDVKMLRFNGEKYLEDLISSIEIKKHFRHYAMLLESFEDLQQLKDSPAISNQTNFLICEILRIWIYNDSKTYS